MDAAAARIDVDTVHARRDPVRGRRFQESGSVPFGRGDQGARRLGRGNQSLVRYQQTAKDVGREIRFVGACFGRRKRCRSHTNRFELAMGGGEGRDRLLGTRDVQRARAVVADVDAAFGFQDPDKFVEEAEAARAEFEERTAFAGLGVGREHAA